jgi:hypothetical protein
MSIIKKNTVPLPVKVEFCFISDILSFTRIFDVYAQVALKPGKDFWHFYSSPGSIEFSEKSGTKPAGTFFQSQVKLYFPGVDDSAEASLLLLNNGKVVLKVYFNDESIRFVGSPEAPVRLTTELTQNNTKSGVVVLGNVQSPEKSRFLVATESIIPPPEL